MGEKGVRPASWRDLPGHKSVGTFASQDEAIGEARIRLRSGSDMAYYVSSLRGAWEVIEYRL